MKFVRFLLFNRFASSYRKYLPAFFSKKKRILGVLLEFNFLAALLFFPLLITMAPLMTILVASNVTEKELIIDVTWCVLLSLLSIIILNKDLWNGQSIVHRQLGYKVVHAKTGETASKIRCFLRNITFVCCIIEVIPLLFSPNRRIGDLIAGTKIIRVTESDPTEILEEMKQTKWDSDLKWTLFLSFMFVVLSVTYFISTGFSNH